MFNKLKCLFSFNWFYIIFFIVLSVYTFWDEITIGHETIKYIKNEGNVYKECSVVKEKINFIDMDNIPYSDDLVIYDGEIKFMYFRPVLNKDQGSKYSKSKKDELSFITIDEFVNCLQALYDNNYIIVDIYDIYKQVYRDGRFKVQMEDLKIPKGKIPFVLFIDDFGYEDHKLTIDGSDINIINSEGYECNDKSVITVLNDFIKDHEDFSFNKGKGIISLLDCESIFGYNTGKSIKRNSYNIKRLSSDIYEAKKVAEKLKEEGFRFAFNTYGNIDFKNVTSNVISTDMGNWFRYVSNIIGYTNIFVADSIIDKNDERFKYLNDNGFNIFISTEKFNNKESYKIEDSINISRDLICYNNVNSNKKDYYGIFKNTIKPKTKFKNKYKGDI